MITENTVVMKWMLRQPEVKKAMEASLKQLPIEKIEQSTALCLAAWFHGMRVDDGNYLVDSKGNRFNDFRSKWFTDALEYLRKESEAPVQTLLEEIGINSVFFNKTHLKEFGAAIKETMWWKEHRTEITRQVKRRNVVKKVMDS